MIILSLLIPLLTALLIVVLGRWQNVRDASSLAGAAALTVNNLCLMLAMPSAAPWVVGEILPRLPFSFAIEPLGALFGTMAAFLWGVTALYAIGYMRVNKEQHQTRFFTLFALAITATMGIAYAENLFTLFLCYELLTLSTLPLVVHHTTPEARAAGRIYLLLLLGTSLLLLLPAIAWTYHMAGTTSFRSGGILPTLSAVPLALLLALFVFGTGKAALMPFHRWLPAAMVAPAPVSALLHAVAVVKSGVFIVMKLVLYIFGLEALQKAGAASQWLLWVALGTALLAAGIAVRQDDFKKRLAYSTVSQLSYILMAVATFTPLGIVAGALHMLAHGFGKITLFFTAGAVYTSAHKTKVSELKGMASAMPVTFACYAIGAASLIGLPLTLGFASKWHLVKSLYYAGQPWVLGGLFLGTILSMAYLLPVLGKAYAGGSRKTITEAPLSMRLALCLSAGGSVLLLAAVPWLIGMIGMIGKVTP